MRALHSTPALAVPLLLSIFAGGCSTPPTKVITEFRTETVYVDRYVEIPGALTRPVEIESLPPDFLTMSDGDAAIAAGVAYAAQTTRTIQCNGKLAEISALGPDPEQ